MAIILLIFLTTISATRFDRDFEFSRNLDIFHSVMRELDLFYVDEIDPAQSITSAIVSMLAKLDPYTSYIPESQMEDLRLMTTGEYGGVGAMIGEVSGTVIVTDPYEGSPSEMAGIRPGDRILRIDNRSVQGKSSEEISMLMKGQVGTPVELTVERPFTGETITFKLVRQNIRLPNVAYYSKQGSTGYIRQTGFTEGAGAEVKRAFEELKKLGINQLVLDLRGNPGGLLLEAVEVMNIFVARNQEIVSTRGKNKQWESTYYTRNEPVDTLIPVAVLVNSSSASAAEIVAGAMQDLDRGVVLGMRTFGKGLVQTTRDLSYRAKLKLTTGKYYIPSGRCIQALDYTHRRSDGSVGKVPDSLVNAFKTKNGRIVYDGGGVSPDLQVEPAVLSKLASNLVYRYKIFDYANRYRNTREAVPDLGSFRVDKAIYDDFRDFVHSGDFEYQTASEQALNELIRRSQAERYYDSAKDLFSQLESALKPDLEKDLDLFREEISTLLEEEILSRYYNQRGRIEHMLKSDPAVKRAKALLSDKAERERLLGAQ